MNMHGSSRSLIPAMFFPLYSSVNNYLLSERKSETLNFIAVSNKNINPDYLNKINNRKDVVMVLETSHSNGFADQRAAFFKLMNAGCRVPVVIKRTYTENKLEDLQLKSSSDLGALFLDGMGDGIWIENKGEIPYQDLIHTAFEIYKLPGYVFPKQNIFPARVVGVPYSICKKRPK